MRAFVVNQLDHPSNIELTKDAPEPKPALDMVLVDVYSAGLNFFDVSNHFFIRPITLSTALLSSTFFFSDPEGSREAPGSA